MSPCLRALAPLSLALAALGGLSACGALDEFEHVMEDEATIPGTYGMSGPFTLGYNGAFDGVRLDQAKSFQNAGVTPSDVDAIFVRSARVEGKNPAIDRLDVLINSIEIWVEADGVPRATIATITELPMNATGVDLAITDPTLNLKPFAVAPAMKVGATVNLRQRPSFNTTLKTTIKLLVDINLLGS